MTTSTQTKTKPKKKKFIFGVKSDRQVDGDRINGAAAARIRAEGGAGVSVSACMQCGACSGGCPNVEQMDLSPRTLVLMAQRGEWETILKSNTLWLCSSCHTCTSRCPRGVRPSEIIEAVKSLAIRDGVANDSVRFSQIFVEIIQKWGLLFEPELILEYGGLPALLEQAPLGVRLLLKGKLSPLPGRVKNPRAFRQALAKTL